MYIHDPETGALRPAWSENVPSHAYTGHHMGSLVVGVSGGGSGRDVIDRAFKRHAAEANKPPKPTCGVMMPSAKQPCARRPGHAFGHATRAALDDAAQRKLDRARAA